ncbi:MAG: hypothetical protein K0S71_1593 [Clostridia bacterium]|jgi:hypothetical protein|nr:hypothetical protein [Clostridia bacterium]
MNKSIESTLKLLEECIIEDGGIVDLDWCDGFLFPFYKHFNDENNKISAQSVLAFLGLLSEWEDQSGFPFFTGTGKYDCHHFDKYMKEFMRLKDTIEERLPNLFKVIIVTLQKLDGRDSFKKVFHHLPVDFINSIIDFIYSYRFKICNPNDPIYQSAIREAFIDLNR